MKPRSLLRPRSHETSSWRSILANHYQIILQSSINNFFKEEFIFSVMVYNPIDGSPIPIESGLIRLSKSYIHIDFYYYYFFLTYSYKEKKNRTNDICFIMRNWQLIKLFLEDLYQVITSIRFIKRIYWESYTHKYYINILWTKSNLRSTSYICSKITIYFWFAVDVIALGHFNSSVE